LLRVLLIAEAANPEWVSVPLVGWSLAHSISACVSAHIVTQVRNRDAFLRAGQLEGRDFTAIDSERISAPMTKASNFIRGGDGVGWTTRTAADALGYYYFEWLVWKRFGAAIRRHEFDIVHRITPLSPTTPSILAKRCARASTPFILGPLNGGVAWPAGFDSLRRKEREWLSYVRGAYRLMPGYRSTLVDSAAIIVGSLSTLNDIPRRFREKCVYLPENAIDPAKFSASDLKPTVGVLRACFVGRLVPYKGPDMLLEAVAPLIKAGRLHLDIIGDGPLMPALAASVKAHGLESGIALRGWLSHDEMQPVMRESQLLLFPSIREFGGGVVLEAMAMGLVPVVVDYAGPGELVSDAVGFKIPMGPRAAIVTRLRDTVSALCDDPAQLIGKSQAARDYVRKFFTWDVKARQVTAVYDWVLKRRPDKPDFFAVPAAETL
jgi:glycosyltransferase involved in cell wall biosynthesis